MQRKLITSRPWAAFEYLPLLLFLQQNAKKRKLEDGGEEDRGKCQSIRL